MGMLPQANLISGYRQCANRLSTSRNRSLTRDAHRWYFCAYENVCTAVCDYLNCVLTVMDVLWCALVTQLSETVKIFSFSFVLTQWHISFPVHMLRNASVVVKLVGTRLVLNWCCVHLIYAYTGVPVNCDSVSQTNYGLSQATQTFSRTIFSTKMYYNSTAVPLLQPVKWPVKLTWYGKHEEASDHLRQLCHQDAVERCVIWCWPENLQESAARLFVYMQVWWWFSRQSE